MEPCLTSIPVPLKPTDGLNGPPASLDNSLRMSQNADVAVITVLLGLAVTLAVVRTYHLIRSRAMRGSAAKLGYRYLGPTAPPKWWWNPAHFEGHPSLPPWVSHIAPSGCRMRQVWNVIEGNVNGASVLIFDAVIGQYKGGHPVTLIACQTEKSPFDQTNSHDHVMQTHGWTVLHGAWVFWFSWLMGTGRIEKHLSEMRVQ
jgi:hypothetical protein